LIGRGSRLDRTAGDFGCCCVADRVRIVLVTIGELQLARPSVLEPHLDLAHGHAKELTQLMRVLVGRERIPGKSLAEALLLGRRDDRAWVAPRFGGR